MTHDPIIEEIHRIREEISAERGHDLHETAESARQRQAKSGRPSFARPPRRITTARDTAKQSPAAWGRRDPCVNEIKEDKFKMAGGGIGDMLGKV